MALWKHLEKCYLSIYRELKPSSTLNPLSNFFSIKGKYLEKTQELTKERCIDLIIETDTPFVTLRTYNLNLFVHVLHNVMC